MPPWRLALFSGPSLPLAALGLPLVVFLPPYYAGEMGLDLALVGLIFFIVRAIDLPLDLLLGVWMDRTRGRFGRFAPWLMAGALVLLLATWMLFMAVRGVGHVYLFGWLLLLYAGYSMLMLSHLAWAATLSASYHGRSRVFGWWQSANLAGLVLVLLLPALVGGEGSAAPGVHAMGWFILATLPLTAAGALAVTRDSGGAHAATAASASWRSIWALLGDPTLRAILAADLLISLAPGVTGALFRFFFEAYLGFTPASAGLLLLAYFIAGLLGVPLWLRLSRRLGKPRTAALAACAALVTNAAVIWLPRGDLALALPGMIIAGLPYAAATFLLRAMLADYADERRLADGVDRIALLNALLTTTQKIGYALPVGLVYPVLSGVGFDPVPGAANSASALWALLAMWVGATGLLFALGAVILARLPFSPARHAEWRARFGDKG